MLNSHVYARAIRDYTLLHQHIKQIWRNILLYQQASFTDAQIDDYTNDFLEGYIEDILKGTVLYENIEESTYIFQPLLKQFNDKLNELEDRGPSYGYNIFTSYQ